MNPRDSDEPVSTSRDRNVAQKAALEHAAHVINNPLTTGRSGRSTGRREKDSLKTANASPPASPPLNASPGETTFQESLQADLIKYGHVKISETSHISGPLFFTFFAEKVHCTYYRMELYFLWIQWAEAMTPEWLERRQTIEGYNKKAPANDFDRMRQLWQAGTKRSRENGMLTFNPDIVDVKQLDDLLKNLHKQSVESEKS